ncbi:MAG TPA: LysM domain-containing protein [Macromonas sp.]|nr:LysM domain-containing protein [Macromonas sp.]
MTTVRTASTAVVAPSSGGQRLQRTAIAGLLGLAVLGLVQQARASDFPNYPITSGQRSTAQQVAQAGVPLSELAPDAPERYTIKSGDTLWGISGMYLKRPWRWPELWGMNMQQVRNPHLIFPGQVLVLTRIGDRAVLSFAQGGAIPTTKLSPRIRAESLADTAIKPIPANVIEPFLTESLVVDGETHNHAPRIVAAPETRVLLSRGDRAYARGQYGTGEVLDGTPLKLGKDQPRHYRVYREATPLKDPASGELLGYEAQFIGKADLVREESTRIIEAGERPSVMVEPATIDITLSKEELRVNDRLLPEPAREAAHTYIPHAPAAAQAGQIVKVHGAAVQYAGQNQVVIINRGAKDGMERGHVLAILKDAKTVTDKTDGNRTRLHLPGERNGLMMVFRTFDRVSYALVLEVTDGVQVGDRFVNP